MKTKNIFLSASIALFAVACSNNNQTSENTSEVAQETTLETTTLNVDLEQSKVNWKGSVVGMHFHEGFVTLKDGSVELNGDQLAGGSFTIDMTSINPTDENYSEEKTAEMLVGHLSSPDFFDVTNNPTASFTITSVDGNTAKGTLNLRGKASEETITDIAITEQNGVKTMSGKVTFDRTKYDVSFVHPLKEVVLSNDIDLNINLVAKG